MFNRSLLLSISRRVVLMLSLLFSFSALATEINMYDQPKAESKVVGKVDLSTGIIPIFTPKDTNWLKIADPRNGNVGWIKSADIKTATGGATSFTFTQKTLDNGKGPATFSQVIKIGQPEKIDAETQKILDRLQAQQQAIQQNMQNNMKQMMKDLGDLFVNQSQQFQQSVNPAGLQPVVAVPTGGTVKK